MAVSRLALGPRWCDLGTFVPSGPRVRARIHVGMHASADPSTGGRDHALFIEDFVDVPCPQDRVRRRIGTDDAWLAELANSASAAGDAMLTRIGPSWAAGVLTRTVQIRLGVVHERGSTTVVPISWASAAHKGLFPVLTGDLEITPLGADCCRVGLSASYRTPFGQLGRSLDRAVLHHVAQSTVRSFLDTIAVGLRSEVNGGKTPDVVPTDPNPVVGRLHEMLAYAHRHGAEPEDVIALIRSTTE
jgi:hypothetical protein